MDVMQAIKKRYSVRSYQDRPVQEKKLKDAEARRLADHEKKRMDAAARSMAQE